MTFTEGMIVIGGMLALCAFAGSVIFLMFTRDKKEEK